MNFFSLLENLVIGANRCLVSHQRVKAWLPCIEKLSIWQKYYLFKKTSHLKLIKLSKCWVNISFLVFVSLVNLLLCFVDNFFKPTFLLFWDIFTKFINLDFTKTPWFLWFHPWNFFLFLHVLQAFRMKLESSYFVSTFFSVQTQQSC